MSSGLPVVVSPLDGIAHELLGDPPSGVIVESESSEDYAREIVRLLTDPAAGRALGISARRRVLEIFDSRRLAQVYAAFFRAILSGDNKNLAIASAGTT